MHSMLSIDLIDVITSLIVVNVRDILSLALDRDYFRVLMKVTLNLGGPDAMEMKIYSHVPISSYLAHVRDRQAYSRLLEEDYIP